MAFENQEITEARYLDFLHHSLVINALKPNNT